MPHVSSLEVVLYGIRIGGFHARKGPIRGGFSVDQSVNKRVLDLTVYCREGWWVHNPQTGQQELAGFVKKGGNLRLVLVRNAGHSVPLNQPLWALRKY